MWWQVGLVCSAVAGLAYFLVGCAILRQLIKSGQFQANLPGAATSAIFLSCAVHRALLFALLVVPFIDSRNHSGAALRSAYGWELGLWDLVAAAVGTFFWALRRTHSSVIKGATLFADIRQRERQALQLNDAVLQGLVVAKLAFELDDDERGFHALDTSISAVGNLVNQLLALNKTQAGGLQRNEAATLKEEK